MKSKFLLKRHFQLLEVIVAAFILLVCAAPALKVFTNIYIEQQEVVRENQRDHIARLIHADVVEQLYKRTIPLDDLRDRREREVITPELKALLKKWSYEGTYVFTNVREYKKKGEEKPIKYLVDLTIGMRDTSKRGAIKNKTPPDYDYEIYINSGAIKENKKQAPTDDDLDDEDEDQLMDDSEGRFDGSLGPEQEDIKPKK